MAQGVSLNIVKKQDDASSIAPIFPDLTRDKAHRVTPLILWESSMAFTQTNKKYQTGVRARPPQIHANLNAQRTNTTMS